MSVDQNVTGASIRGVRLPIELSVVYCDKCYRNSLATTLKGRHFYGGKLCVGIFKEARYVRLKP